MSEFMDTEARSEGREAAAADQDAEGPVTSEKPGKHYQIDIFRGWCKSCGICAAFCPRNCIEQDEEGSPVVEDCDRCTGCGWCELHCPDFAISVRPKVAPKVQPEED